MSSELVILFATETRSILFDQLQDLTLQSGYTNGLKWSWGASIDFSTVRDGRGLYMRWNFSWGCALAHQGIEGLTGHIVVSFPRSKQTCMTFYVELRNPDENKFEKLIGSYDSAKSCFNVQFRFTGYRSGTEFPTDHLFLKSDSTDGVLLVDGKRMHVNKTFLAFHSEFFRVLFNGDFKERALDEIPIKDVAYTDIAHLLAVVYPNPTLPTDETCEKLLQLAERFMMPAVTKYVEEHLYTDPHVTLSRMMMLADKYKLEDLLGKVIDSITCPTHVKKIQKSQYFTTLTPDTKLALLDKLCTLC